jgi:hypothetical protein
LDYEWLSPEQQELVELFSCSCGVAVVQGVKY